MALILVVEDQAELRQMFRMMLEHLGYEVIEAADGSAGLNQLRHKPDLVILDLNMPVASGDIVLGYIKSTPDLANTRVVIVSAHPNAETIARQLGADGFLGKPVSLDQIANAVNQALA
ncbi:response regulator [Chloroflexota bacterium]